MLVIVQRNPTAPFYDLRIHPDGLGVLVGSDAVRGRGRRWWSVDPVTAQKLERTVCGAGSFDRHPPEQSSEHVILSGPGCAPPVQLRYRRYADDAGSGRAQELTERILHAVGAFPLTPETSRN